MPTPDKPPGPKTHRGTVDVWLIHTDLPEAAAAELRSLLGDEESRRAAATANPADRRRYTVAHAALRLILARHLGASPGDLAWRAGPHGKPELAGAWAGRTHFSLSGSGDLAMLAVSAKRRVGVDLQILPPAVAAMRVARRFFPPAEADYVIAGGRSLAAHRFTMLWARKEACVKVYGGRLVDGMKLPVRQASRFTLDGRDGALPGLLQVTDLRSPTGFRAALAVEGEQAYRVTRHRWPEHVPDKSVHDDSALNDSALNDSALNDSALNDSALNDSALNDAAIGDPTIRTGEQQWPSGRARSLSPSTVRAPVSPS
jgi:4'-phosphopantetheinyl transferase